MYRKVREKTIDTNIVLDELSALITHERLLVQEPALCYDTDGSCLESHIGAAAIRIESGAKRKNYTGQQSGYSIYIGELYGIMLTLEFAIDESADHPEFKVMIFIDNQSAKKALANHR